MDKFSLVYHKTLQGVICMAHHVLIKPSYVLYHVQSQHAKLQFSSVKATDILNNIWKVPAKPIDLERGLYHQFQGLPVYLGHRCAECGYLSSAPKKVAAHVRQEHDHAFDSADLEYVPIQRYSQTKIPFPIIPTSPPVTTTIDAVINTFTSAVANTFKTPQGVYTANARLVSQWLLRMEWPTIVKGHDVVQLYKAVQKPVADDTILRRASFITKRLTNIATQNISLLPRLVLQRLNTSDKAKTCVVVVDFLLLLLLI